jgi:hypothetical protein
MCRIEYVLHKFWTFAICLYVSNVLIIPNSKRAACLPYIYTAVTNMKLLAAYNILKDHF